MPAISGRKKNAGKVGSEQNVSKFGPEKMPVFSGRDKIAGKLAIVGELTGLVEVRASYILAG